jgi:hypothetical protein
MCDLQAEQVKARQQLTISKLLRKPTPALASAESVKIKTYAPLTHMAELLQRNGSRRSVPKFLPCIISHEGEFSPGCFELIEWLTSVYKRQCSREGPRPDGLTLTQLTATFRTRLKDNLITAVVTGFGGMLAASSAGFILP